MNKFLILALAAFAFVAPVSMVRAEEAAAPAVKEEVKTEVKTEKCLDEHGEEIECPAEAAPAAEGAAH